MSRRWGDEGQDGEEDGQGEEEDEAGIGKGAYRFPFEFCFLPVVFGDAVEFFGERACHFSNLDQGGEEAGKGA